MRGTAIIHRLRADCCICVRQYTCRRHTKAALKSHAPIAGLTSRALHTAMMRRSCLVLTLLRAPELCKSDLRPWHTSACSLAKPAMARNCVSKPGIESCLTAFSSPVCSKQCRRTCLFLSETTVTITGIFSSSCPRPEARQGPRRSMTACYAILSATRCRTLLEEDDWRGEC